MEAMSTKKLAELQSIITKMPLEVCCVAVLPEFGVKWREVSRAVREARLPMVPASIARVLCRHVAKSLTAEEVDEIVTRLRLKLIATQTRTWHVVRLMERNTDEPVTTLLRILPARIVHVLKKGKNRGMRPQVESILLGDLMYLSIQLVSELRQGSVLYVATPPGEPVALVSSLSMVGLLRACVAGLGYKSFESANLHGRDIKSLLRINDRAWNGNADHLTEIPEYAPIPVISNHGIDYTNKDYDGKYVRNILGPEPPLLTDLSIKTTKPFFDPSRLNKIMNLSIQLKSENVAKSLETWVTKGALGPTSDFFKIFHQIKSNKIVYSRDDSD